MEYAIENPQSGLTNTSNDITRRPFRREKRIQLSISPLLHEKMKEAQKETGAKTLDDVALDAFITYLALVKEYKNGKEVIVRSTEGKEKSYALFIRSY